ncbi:MULTISPECIES: DUF2267 domain-containing protein [Natrialbaceae]|uniref:DUF2267 domain-containing protein n=1 Tax=Natrialbaceae TaxID=1644061 RepID=UPI00207C1F09|nr:DUF2267 domain-containing protein [Natronococcus sp. CG52]
MVRHDFYDSVEQRANLADETDAQNATQAVVSSLGERIDEHRSRRLADDLPREIDDHLTGGESGQQFSEEEFISRVNQRTETVDVTGEHATTAVLGTTLEAVDESERAAAVDQFEHYGFEELLSETDTEVDVTDRTPRER